MVVGTRPIRPTEQSLCFSDRHVVDAGLTPTHQVLGIEFPLLITVCAISDVRVIVPFILEADRDPVVVKGP
jgi:hypothetical protein